MPARERLEFDILARDVNTRRTLDGIADSVEDTGRSFDVMSTRTSHLDIEIDRLTASVGALKQAFDETGDTEFLRAIKRDQSSLVFLQKMRKEMRGIADDTVRISSATGGRGLFGAALGSPLLAAGLGAGAVFSPFLGGVAGGGILGGAGLAGIGAGAASAAMGDAQVRAQFKTVGDEFAAMFHEMGEPFRAPLKKVAAEWRHDVGQMRDDWVESIGGLAEHVEPLAEGFSGLVEKAGPGLRRMLEATGPVLDMIGGKLPGLGEDFSTFADSIAASGPGGAKAIGDLIDAVGDLIVFGGEVIEVLAKTYDALDTFAQRARPVIELLVPLAAALDLMPDDDKVNRIKSAGTAMETVAESTEKATQRLRDWNTAMDEAFGEQMNLDEATDAFKQNFLELNEMIKENGRDLRNSTMAGLDNRAFIRDWIEDAKKMRDAAIAMGNGSKESIEKANGAYQAHLEQIRKMLIQRGFEKKIVDQIIAAYRAMAALPNITKLVTIKFATSGSVPPAAPRGSVIAFQHGGPVGGGTPAGVDAQLRLLASDEWVVRGSAARAIGPAGMAAINNADRTPVGAAVGGASADDIARALARVLQGATLRLDDRTGQTASLLVRGG